jgi:hypothetical protein
VCVWKFAGKIAGVLVEFLEVAITSVIFLKGIYPSGLFIHLFNLGPVWINNLFAAYSTSAYHDKYLYKLFLFLWQKINCFYICYKLFS